MSLATARRSLRRPLLRSFTTTSTCQKQKPPPPRPPIPRKGRTPKIDPTTQSLLPPEKLRALVSLYHQSENFITEENLLQRIDSAFLYGATQQRSQVDKLEHRFLREALKAQRNAPRIAPWYHSATHLTQASNRGGEGFSDQAISGRERDIVDALYGVESGSRPGYETLVEAMEANEAK